MSRPVGLRGWGHRPSPGSGARGEQWPAQVELRAAPGRLGGMGRPGVCRLVLLAACLELCGPRGALGGTRPNFPSPPGAGQTKLRCAERVGGRVGARAGEAAGRAGRAGRAALRTPGALRPRVPELAVGGRRRVALRTSFAAVDHLQLPARACSPPPRRELREF